MLVPVIGLVQVGLQARADRYTYLPHIGLYIALTWAVADFSRRWRYRSGILTTAAVAIIVALSVLAYKQTAYWKNSGTLFTRTLAVTSNNSIAEQNLEYFLLERHQFDAAKPHLENALKIWPDYRHGKMDSRNAWVHCGLGRVLTESGKTREGMDEYQKALALLPDNAVIHDEIGRTCARNGDLENAIVNWEKSLALAPDTVLTLEQLAWLLATCPDAGFRNGARAVQLAQRADQLSNGSDPGIIRALAAAYGEVGRFDRAIAEAKRALEIARARRNSALADALQLDLDLYQMGFPCRNYPSRDLPQEWH